MPSVVAAYPSHSPQVSSSKSKFKTVLGFGSVARASLDLQPHPAPSAHSASDRLTFARQSVDTARSYTYRKKHKAAHHSVASVSLFHSTQHTPSQPPSIIDLTLDNSMTIENTVANRRPPPRIEAQEGPWSVSVAETPHDAHSYSLYIKTPTHNLTLTRTAVEMVDLDRKIRVSYPTITLPSFPIDPQTLIPAPKRKSTFLNTLSRLASPTSAKSARRLQNASSIPSSFPTPLTSPSAEINDPFTSIVNDAAAFANPSATSTGLAAYLTTVSNNATIRQARVWKRFVRVRTDDLESVRVERAIKRVRSDLAAHVGLAKDKENVQLVNSKADPGVPSSEDASIPEEKIERPEEQVGTTDVDVIVAEGAKETEQTSVAEVAASEAAESSVASASFSQSQPDSAAQSKPAEKPDSDTAGAQAEETPSTPLASEASSTRIPRSQSADFGKSRASRIYASSVPSQDGASSQTGDESSVSTKEGSRRTSGRKKRSVSMAPKEPKKSQRKVVINDFEMMRVLGKGCAGKVLLVRHRATGDLYALKAITKRHVLAHQELQHTLTEQAVLKRMSAESRDPFVVKLWWSFHDKENLFLVMDFHPGGDLATQLARWGRLGRDRARFYAAEIVEGVEGLHAAGVIYRDLKPENILIGGDGHIVLTDFGLSKEFPRRTNALTAPSTPNGSRNGDFYSSATPTLQPATPPWMRINNAGELALGWPGQPAGHSDSTATFCGTAEYLAPEVIQGLPYSYEVDWWSFGTMLFEMLTGITPYWANNHSEMYVRVLQDELQFPEDRAIDHDTKSLIRGLLQRDPALRIREPRIKRHPYFSMIDWSHVYYKRYIPPYIPPIDPSNASDTQNFDDTFLDMEPVLDEFNDDQMETDQEPEQTDTDRTDGDESNTTPSQSRSSSVRPGQQATDNTVDVFDGYSFKGRHSILLDEDDEEEEEEEEEEVEEEEALASVMGPELIVESELMVEEDIVEPKTPEARPVILAEPPAADVPALEEKELEPPVKEEPILEEPEPRKSKELPPVVPSESVPPSVPEKEAATAKPTAPAKPANVRPANNRQTRPRKERSGIPALDRYLSDTVDEDTEITEREDDDDDDDWDFVEAVDGEDRNGAKGTSLFARGVVDRYRLAVFRKASTPSQRSNARSVSGMSKNSDATVLDSGDSPSPTQRRGRAQLPFRKRPRQFLRPKSPSKSSATTKSMTNSNSNTLSAASSISGALTASQSLGSTLPMSPSLKSKESAMSVGDHSLSSDQSGHAEPGTAEVVGVADALSRSPRNADEPEKHKNKKLKKYKENAEKVFSIFSSPRQAA